MERRRLELELEQRRLELGVELEHMLEVELERMLGVVLVEPSSLVEQQQLECRRKPGRQPVRHMEQRHCTQSTVEPLAPERR